MKKWVIVTFFLLTGTALAEAPPKPVVLECPSKASFETMKQVLGSKCYRSLEGNGEYELTLTASSDCDLYLGQRLEVYFKAQQDYEKEINERVLKNWVVPSGVQVYSVEKPIVISALITKDGQVYNTSVLESSEPKGVVSYTYADPKQQAYSNQLQAYYRQNHLIADSSAKAAVETVQLPKFPDELKGQAYEVRIIFDLKDKKINSEMGYTLDPKSQALVKTATPPIFAVAKPMTTEQQRLYQMGLDTQAQYQQQQAAQAQTMHNAKINMGIMHGVGILQQALPLLNRL